MTVREWPAIICYIRSSVYRLNKQLFIYRPLDQRHSVTGTVYRVDLFINARAQMTECYMQSTVANGSSVRFMTRGDLLNQCRKLWMGRTTVNRGRYSRKRRYGAQRESETKKNQTQWKWKNEMNTHSKIRDRRCSNGAKQKCGCLTFMQHWDT